MLAIPTVADGAFLVTKSQIVAFLQGRFIHAEGLNRKRAGVQ